MKKAVIIITAGLLGAGALAYPSVSDYLTRKNGSEILQDYTIKIARLDSETISRAWAEAERYNETLAKTNLPLHDFLTADTAMDTAMAMDTVMAMDTAVAMPEEYNQTLNIGGIMGYVDIPGIDIYLPIYHGTGDYVLNRGAGHLEGSALPIGGSSRHSVITGHSGLVHARMFTDLSALKAGDLFYIHVLGEILAYEVDKISIIEPDITDELAQFEGKDYCTLLTCTPYGINTHRLLVRGERIEFSPEAKAAIQPIPESGSDDTVVRVAIITTSIMLILIAIAAVVSGRRRRAGIECDEAS